MISHRDPFFLHLRQQLLEAVLLDGVLCYGLELGCNKVARHQIKFDFISFKKI